ncbi:MAG: quinolinate synthase NadA [Paludibacteraceae bacterium]|nr:quinolinate synthase NadA [Paludibacteraceae bacterium]
MTSLEQDIKQQIRDLCRQKNAVVMAHYYQRAEVQSVADFVGDSLALAQQAQKTDADIIVMCGVHFMAETAAILCPERKVLIPDASAGCSLADSCQAADLRAWKAQHPDHLVVSYVNTSAEVKALSDIVVTSGNALKIVNRLPQDAKILFGPDRNLGRYINERTGRKMDLWNGCCHVHDRFSAENLVQLKQQYPQALVLAHPECRKEIVDQSDVVGSTAVLIQYVKEHPDGQYIVMTADGVDYEIYQSCPNAHLINTDNACEYMHKHTLESVLACLQNEAPVVTVDAQTAMKATLPIHRMLDWSK